MTAQLILVRQQGIQSPVETIIANLVAPHTQKIVQGRLLIPRLSDLQLGGWGTETGQHKNRGDDRPRDLFPARGHLFFAKLSKAEPGP